MTYSKTYFTKSLMLLLTLGIALADHSIAFFCFSVFWTFLGDLIIRFALSKDIRESAKQIFYLFVFAYSLYSYLCNESFVTNPFTTFFVASDSLNFYSVADHLGRLDNIGSIIHTAFTDWHYGDYIGFASLSGIIAWLANHIDGNTIMIQKLTIVFCSAIILPFLYNILSLYFDKKRAFNLTISYGLFSFSLFYSAILVRDVPIGVCYIVFFYNIYRRKSLFKLFCLSLLSVTTYYLRPEHGLFSSMFLLLYLYLWVKDSNFKRKYIFAFAASAGLIVLGIIFSKSLYYAFTVYTSTTDTYNALTNNAATVNGGLGASLLKLPFGIRHIVIGLWSQIIPFPFYFLLDDITRVPESVAEVYWFMIWSIILFGFIKKGELIVKDKSLFFLFCIGILLVLAATSNASTRRVMSMYPIFFIVAMQFFYSFSKRTRIKIISISTSLYIFLMVLLLLMKAK